MVARNLRPPGSSSKFWRVERQAWRQVWPKIHGYGGLNLSKPSWEVCSPGRHCRPAAGNPWVALWKRCFGFSVQGPSSFPSLKFCRAFEWAKEERKLKILQNCHAIHVGSLLKLIHFYILALVPYNATDLFTLKGLDIPIQAALES